MTEAGEGKPFTGQLALVTGASRGIGAATAQAARKNAGSMSDEEIDRFKRAFEYAVAKGKHVYCEKPVATNLTEALGIVAKAKAAGIKHGVVQDKLFLPGLLKLKIEKFFVAKKIL